MTGIPLKKQDIKPNANLREAIDAWLIVNQWAINDPEEQE